MFLLWKIGPGLCPFKDTQGFVEVWSSSLHVFVDVEKAFNHLPHGDHAESVSRYLACCYGPFRNNAFKMKSTFNIYSSNINLFNTDGEQFSSE